MTDEEAERALMVALRRSGKVIGRMYRDEEIETIRAAARAEAIRAFANDILHGDSEHRSWLLEAAETFIAGKPMPTVRGGANAAARVEALREARALLLECGFIHAAEAIRSLSQVALSTKKPGQREADPG